MIIHDYSTSKNKHILMMSRVNNENKILGDNEHMCRQTKKIML